jgi:hypothetical protein
MASGQALRPIDQTNQNQIVPSCEARAASEAGQTSDLTFHHQTHTIFADAIGNLISIWVWMFS